MLTYIPTIFGIASAIGIIMAIFWRFSLFIKLIIEKYKDDGKIDHDDLTIIYNDALSMFSWIFALFNVKFEQLVSEVDEDPDDPDDPDEE